MHMPHPIVVLEVVVADDVRLTSTGGKGPPWPPRLPVKLSLDEAGTAEVEVTGGWK